MRRVPLDGPIVLPQLIPLRMAFGGTLAVGRTYTIRVFDPVQLSGRDVAIEVAAESTLIVPQDTAVFDAMAGRWVPVVFDTVRAWRIRDASGRMPFDSWIDDGGRLLAAQSAIGFRLVRSAYEVVYENFRMRDTAAALAAGTDLIRGTAIAANVRLAPDTLRDLALRLSGQSLAGLDLDGGRQRLVGDTVFIERETRIGLAGGLPPAHGGGGSGSLPAARAAHPERRPRPAGAGPADHREHPAAGAGRAAAHAVGVREPPQGGLGGRTQRGGRVRAPRGRLQRAHGAVHGARARGRASRPARPRDSSTWTARSTITRGPRCGSDDWVAVDPTFGQFPADAAHLRLTDRRDWPGRSSSFDSSGVLDIEVVARRPANDPTRRTHEALRHVHRRQRDRPARPARGAVRLPRPQRRRQDHDAPHDRRHPATDRPDASSSAATTSSPTR